jgi:polysaccharide deacetylase family protein (PEP-CTERM system associated)
MTFDVEEHFQIEAARPYVAPGSWDGRESRVERNVEWLLEQLAGCGAKATFFTLGWIARRRPAMVRRIVEAGHELACHGDEHDRLHRLTPVSFAEDLKRSIGSLEQAGGVRVGGYRAPTFSLTRQTAWAIDVLAQAGIVYDSSVQPIHHPQYGERDAPRWAYRLTSPLSGVSLAEIPPLTWQSGPLRLPVAGGGYFRLLPLALMRWGIEQAHALGHPAMLYFHPWEFDPDQPRLPLGRAARWRTYVGITQTRERLRALLRDYRSVTVSDWLSGVKVETWPEWAFTPVAA